MIVLTYEMDLDSDEGLIISNAATHWEDSPEEINFEKPPIVIRESDKRPGDFWPTLENYAHCNPREVNKDNAVLVHDLPMVLRGEVPNWRIIKVRFCDWGITLMLANSKTMDYEFVYMGRFQRSLSFAFETEDERGIKNLYDLYIMGSYNAHRINLTEQFSMGFRTYYLGHYAHSRGHNVTYVKTNERKMHVSVTEYH